MDATYVIVIVMVLVILSMYSYYVSPCGRSNPPFIPCSIPLLMINPQFIPIISVAFGISWLYKVLFQYDMDMDMNGYDAVFPLSMISFQNSMGYSTTKFNWSMSFPWILRSPPRKQRKRCLRQGVQLQSPAQLGVWLEQLLGIYHFWGDFGLKFMMI